MAAINFPSSPTNGQTYTINGRVWVYDGVSWNAQGSTNYVGYTGSTGAAMIPKGTTAQRDGTPATGYLRYNTTTNQFEGYSSAGWGSIGAGATGASGNAIFWENDQTVTASYTITTGKNAGTFGPVTINSGVIVTVPTTSTWTVV